MKVLESIRAPASAQPTAHATSPSTSTSSAAACCSTPGAPAGPSASSVSFEAAVEPALRGRGSSGAPQEPARGVPAWRADAAAEAAASTARRPAGRDASPSAAIRSGCSRGGRAPASAGISHAADRDGASRGGSKEGSPNQKKSDAGRSAPRSQRAHTPTGAAKGAVPRQTRAAMECHVKRVQRWARVARPLKAAPRAEAERASARRACLPRRSGMQMCEAVDVM